VIDRRTFLLGSLAIAGAGRIRAAASRPNVVLIDAGVWPSFAVPWSSDRETGIQDFPMPSLARFGARATTFSRAYASYSHADGARPCLLTGMFRHALNTRAPGTDARGEFPTLGAVLKQNGYRTQSFTARQADDIVAFVHAGGDAPLYVEWVIENSGGALLERIDRGAINLRPNVPPEIRDRARSDLAAFYARARAHERNIGTVLESLDRPGLAGNTIIVFTAEHGEQFGSHGMFGDDHFYEECMRVPLAILHPRAPAGGRSDVLISQVDIMPSLLKLCGIQPPDSVQGKDLSALLAGQPAERPDSIYGEGRLGMPNEWRMLVRGYDKLVTDMEGHVDRLYNLAEDPFEERNLAEATSEQLKLDSLLAMQQLWMRRLGDGVDPSSGLRRR
jgi:arylsulfatase A-like enzyme